MSENHLPPLTQSVNQSINQSTRLSFSFPAWSKKKHHHQSSKPLLFPPFTSIPPCPEQTKPNQTKALNPLFFCKTKQRCYERRDKAFFLFTFTTTTTTTVTPNTKGPPLIPNLNKNLSTYSLPPENAFVRRRIGDRFSVCLHREREREREMCE